MALAVPFAVESSGTGWFSWVVLAAILLFLAVGFFGIFRGWAKAGIVKWRSRHPESDRPN
jgi:hypothetical protein